MNLHSGCSGNGSPHLHERGPGGKGGRSTRAISLSKLITLEGLTAIDLGCKEGYNAFDLLESGCKKILGVEIRDSYLNEARKECARLNYEDSINFQKGDVRKIDEQCEEVFDVCLCTGLLYHMQNPFNLLKRIRNICRIMALETHIAPDFLFDLLRARKKYRQNLEWFQRSVQLDGEVFQGRLNTLSPKINLSSISGSIAGHATFWLSKKSLLHALDRAGFLVRNIYYGKYSTGSPDIFIDHGVKRLKVFILAEVKNPGEHEPVTDGKIEKCPLLLQP